MNRPIATLMLTSLLGLIAPASAQDQTTPVPGSVHDWVDLQTSGRAASPVDRPIPGDIAERTYQRYAESFSQPIPETLDREEFLSQSGGGSGGSGGGGK